MRSKLIPILVVFLVALAVTTLADVPGTVNYQGYLTDDSGYPITGSLDMTFTLYDAASGGTARWTEVWDEGTYQVVVVDGYYSVLLGSMTSLDTLFEDYPQLWLEIVVSGETLSPLKPLASSAYSREALNADTLDGLDSTDFYKTTDSVDADTLDGQDSTAFADASHSHSFSEITGSVTDAQVPNNITINFAILAGSVGWGGILNMPTGFSDGIDDVGLTVETDPQVGSISQGYVPKWNGSALATGTIYDDGGIGIGTNDRQLFTSLYPGRMSIVGASNVNTLLVSTYAASANSSAGVFHQSSSTAGQPAVTIQSVDGSGSTVMFDVKSGVDNTTGSGGTTHLAVTQSGDVGIGTDSPSARLDVDGNAKISGTLEYAGSGTAIESLPYLISSPGLYYLAGNLTSNGTDAITIGADHVTLDLNGYTLTGTGTAGEDGIFFNGFDNIEIRNGTITGFGENGIFVQQVTNLRVEKVRIQGNGAKGISAYATSSEGMVSVLNCTFHDNSNSGFYAPSPTKSKVVNSTSGFNGDIGFMVSESSLIKDCIAHNNGMDGFQSGKGSTLTNNTSFENSSHGFDTDQGSTLVNNTAYDNGDDGFNLGSGSVLIGNTSRSNNGDGFDVSSHVVVRQNNASFNDDYGFKLSSYCLVNQNVAAYNNRSLSSFTNYQTCASCTMGTNVDGPI